MDWEFFVQCKDDKVQVIESKLDELSRPASPEFSQIGLLYMEGKRILMRLQAAILDQQVAACAKSARSCPQCGRLRNIKNYRPKMLRTLYGDRRVRMPRFDLCKTKCDRKEGERNSIWTGQLFANQATPELVAIKAAFGALLPYRQAAHPLNCFLPAQRKRHHTTLRNHTIRVGEQLDAAAQSYRARENAKPQRFASVAIDSTYARGGNFDEKSKVPITAGRFLGADQHESIFAFVQRHQPDNDQLEHMWRGFGCGERTRVRLVTDGDRGLENMVRPTTPCKTTHILAWFHVAMKLHAISRSLSTTLYCVGYGETRASDVGRKMISIRWHIWQGRIRKACNLLLGLNDRIRKEVKFCESHTSSILQSLLTRIIELRNYLRKYQDGAVKYSKALREGELVSTAPVESLINSLINKRMNKKQQMSWSAWGAHCMLQVRVACVNGVYRKAFESRFSGFAGVQT